MYRRNEEGDAQADANNTAATVKLRAETWGDALNRCVTLA